MSEDDRFKFSLEIDVSGLHPPKDVPQSYNFPARIFFEAMQTMIKRWVDAKDGMNLEEQNKFKKIRERFEEVLKVNGDSVELSRSEFKQLQVIVTEVRMPYEVNELHTRMGLHFSKQSEVFK